MSVLSLALAKSHLNIPAATTTYDTELQTFIDAAEAAIAHQVGPLATETRTDRVRVVSSLVLPVAPVVSVVSATHSDTTALTVGDLLVNTAAGIVTYEDGSSIAPGYYDVVYVAGRASCPADLLMAVKELVRHLWDTQRGPTRRPGSAAGESANVPGAAYMFPHRVTQLLAPYLQPGVA